MPFPWLQCTPPREGGADRRAKAAAAELTSRAGVLYRLGFSKADATRRLVAAVAWEYDSGGKQPLVRRPEVLSDAAIERIVSDAFERRPG
jgi:hypothetical protein